MMHAQMIVAVVPARLGTGGALSVLTARAFAVIAARRRAWSSGAVERGAATSPPQQEQQQQ
jgi:hypothetical protein